MTLSHTLFSFSGGLCFTHLFSAHLNQPHTAHRPRLKHCCTDRHPSPYRTNVGSLLPSPTLQAQLHRLEAESLLHHQHCRHSCTDWKQSLYCTATLSGPAPLSASPKTAPSVAPANEINVVPADTAIVISLTNAADAAHSHTVKRHHGELGVRQLEFIDTLPCSAVIGDSDGVHQLISRATHVSADMSARHDESAQGTLNCPRLVFQVGSPLYAGAFRKCHWSKLFLACFPPYQRHCQQGVRTPRTQGHPRPFCLRPISASNEHVLWRRRAKAAH